MFFFDRKYSKIETRVIRIRDEWGVMHRIEIIKGTPVPTDLELQDELKSTVVFRRLD